MLERAAPADCLGLPATRLPSRLTAAAVGLLLIGLLLAGTPGSARAHPSAPCATRPGPEPQLAPQSEPLTIAASAGETGCIALTVAGAQAPSVSVEEVVPGQPTPTALATVLVHGGRAALASGLPWLCDRPQRTFQVTETLLDGTVRSAQTSLSTPPCSGRIAARLQAGRVHGGYPFTILLADRWRLGGLRVRACLAAPGPADCAAVTIAPGRTSTPLRLRARRQGHVVVNLNDRYQSVRLRLRVLPSRPLLLATGDSEMQVLDEMLGSDLSGEGVRVVGDARQSTAISSPFFFNWPAHAFAQVAGDHPDIVAMFLGGNEGFRLGRAECCGSDWSGAYALRVEGMMRTYLQHGAAAVYWFLVPTPSSEPFVRVVRAVNRGIVIAASHFREGVHVFDLRPVFSPGGRYIDSLTAGGRTITVHESDGFHLSSAADVMVAHMFVARLRRDGLLR